MYILPIAVHGCSDTPPVVTATMGAAAGGDFGVRTRTSNLCHHILYSSTVPPLQVMKMEKESNLNLFLGDLHFIIILYYTILYMLLT